MNSFNKLKNFLELQFQSGISENTPSHLQPFIRQSNINGIIFFILDVSLAPIFYLFTKNYLISFSLIISGLLFIFSSVGLNKLGYSILSRISTSIIGTLIIGICFIVLGVRSQPEVTLILGSILPFTQFHLKEKKELLISLFFPLIILVLLKTFENDLVPIVAIEKSNSISGLFYIYYFSTYFGIAFNTYNNMAEHNLKADNLEKSEKHLGLIFKTLSHDLGSPMQILSVLTERAERSGVVAITDIGRLKKAAGNAVSIYKKIREIAFLNDGKIPVQMSESSILEVIDLASQNIFDLLQKKNLKINIYNLSSHINPVCNLDRELFIYQVLNNILTNAIKFSFNEGLIQIEITDGRELESLCISIKDKGVGISEAAINNIFNWHQATTTIGTAGEAGTGLGLPLVKTFLKAMNMELNLMSKCKEQFPYDHGTTVQILLKVKSVKVNNLNHSELGFKQN